MSKTGYVLPELPGASDLIDYYKINNEILHLLTRSGSRKEFLEKLTSLLKEFMGCSSVGIRVKEEDNQIPYEAYLGYSEEFWEAENWLSLDRDDCICTRVVSRNLRPHDMQFVTPNLSLYCNNLAEMVRDAQGKNVFRGGCLQEGFLSVAVLPVLRGATVLGAIHLADPLPNKFPREKILMLESIMPQIAEAMYRFRLEEELHRNYEHQMALNRILLMAQGEVPIERLVDEAMQILSSISWIPGKPVGVLFDHGRKQPLNGKFFVPITATRNNGAIYFSLPPGFSFKPEEKTFLEVFAGTLAAIIEHRQAENNLHATNRKLTEIIDFLPDATYVVDKERRVIAWNRAIEEMTGVKKEDIIGKTDYASAFTFYGTGRPVLIDLVFENNPELEKLYNVTRRGNTLLMENFASIEKDGKLSFIWSASSPLFDEAGELAGAIETLRDITDQKSLENKLHYLATHDPLTKTANRFSLEENLKRVVARAKRKEKSALLMIDVDNFHLVNETLGHSAGDRFLIQLAEVLRKNLREEDLIARFSGDEFAVILEGKDEDDACTVAEKIRRAIKEEPFSINLSVSIGIVMIDGAIDHEKVLSLASYGLDSVKEKGRNRIFVLRQNEDPTVILSETNQTLAAIRQALKENLFTIHFQPVFCLETGKIMHYEALLRLPDKDNRLIPPGIFIPLAEKYGLMPDLDLWVLKEALRLLKVHEKLNLFVNISGVSLSDEDLLMDITRIIVESGINPVRLGFEITETAAVKNFTQAHRWIERIKSMGCRFALDDFGIGFSSFSYLKKLPVDYIKIDGFFIRNLDTDPEQRTMVTAINSMAKSLGKKTIAEFVENERIVKHLREIGVDCGQGYYLGKPSPDLAE